MQPILYNCSATYPFQTSNIANLISSAYYQFGRDYASQAIYIKKGVEDNLGGGTWEVVITYDVSANTLVEI